MEVIPFSASSAGAAPTPFGLALIAHDGLTGSFALIFTVTTGGPRPVGTGIRSDGRSDAALRQSAGDCTATARLLVQTCAGPARACQLG